jgi:hypothetical protein
VTGFGCLPTGPRLRLLPQRLPRLFIIMGYITKLK